MQITPNWIRLWVLCLASSEGYLAYCNASASDGGETRRSLESEHSCIASVYADFGNIYIDLPTFSLENVKAWIAPRRHLFFSSATVESFSTTEHRTHIPGHLLLDIELSEDISVTLLEVKRHIAAAYLPEISYRLHTGKPGLLPLKPLAKYSLHGDCNLATLGRVKKAVAAGMLRFQNRSRSSEPLSITETVLAIKKKRHNPFGWSMSEDDLDAERRGTFGKYILNSSEITLLKRHRKDFSALVRNTIKGRFPDFS